MLITRRIECHLRVDIHAALTDLRSRVAFHIGFTNRTAPELRQLRGIQQEFQRVGHKIHQEVRFGYPQ